MKKLNALALAAAVAPAVMLGIGTVHAEERQTDPQDELGQTDTDTDATVQSSGAENRPSAAIRDSEETQVDPQSELGQDDSDRDATARSTGADTERSTRMQDSDETQVDPQSELGQDDSDRDAMDREFEADTRGGVAMDRGQMSQISQEEVMGASVQNRRNDRELGKVKDVLLGPNGEIENLVVGVGGFLGIGRRDIIIDWDRVSHSPDAEDGDYALSVDMSDEDIKNAPEQN